MFRDQPSQILALERTHRFENEKLVNIGGRPVIVSNANPQSIRASRSESIKVALAFAAIYLVWGSTYLAIRYAIETIPPLVAAGIRACADIVRGASIGLQVSCWARCSF